MTMKNGSVEWHLTATPQDGGQEGTMPPTISLAPRPTPLQFEDW